ncbi:hypothetical protein Syun_018693 [Stephania yunnanensis]|uniref:Uncharacterized protein n=1 Tax=Stephania yunnanensis TaxID=152371 RepID=A0AAP0NYM7_9MAGN
MWLSAGEPMERRRVACSLVERIPRVSAKLWETARSQILRHDQRQLNEERFVGMLCDVSRSDR